MDMQKQDLYEITGYEFKDLDLAIEALTHPSATQINGGKNYQRLEFLGDKVLSLVISNYLIKQYPLENEGDLSKRHAFLVSGESLSKLALEIGLDRFLVLSMGEKKSGGLSRKSNLENAMEALIGAIYLDGGFDDAQKFILDLWGELLSKNLEPPKDPVSKLQEIVQARTKSLPEYDIVKIGGSDHSPEFEAVLRVRPLGVEFKAKGESKKQAQRRVALMALESGELG